MCVCFLGLFFVLRVLFIVIVVVSELGVMLSILCVRMMVLLSVFLLVLKICFWSVCSSSFVVIFGLLVVWFSVS